MDGQGKLQGDSEGLLLKTNQIEERPKLFVKDYSVYELFLRLFLIKKLVTAQTHCCNLYRPFFLLLLVTVHIGPDWLLGGWRSWEAG